MTAVRRLIFALAALAGCAKTATTLPPKESTMIHATPTMTTSATTPRMQLDVKGEGAPIVMVGGGLTGALSWVPHQERLAKVRKAVRAQPLAVQYGLEAKALPDGYSLEMESGALAAAIEGLGVTDLVAWSYGAAIALDYALDHPDRVRTLTLIEPPAMWVLDAAGTADGETRRESDALRALYRQMTRDVTEDQLGAFVRQAGLVPPGKSPSELPPWRSWVEHRRSLRTGDACWEHKDDAARLRAFRRPALLVRGTGSAHFLFRIIDGLAQTLPRAQVVELPGGHAPQIVAMDAFMERLAAFQE
jgi:pimeloyl-ACP methyl ester carboxylesterase